MKLHCNLTVFGPFGTVKVDIEEWGRKGTLSPTTYIIRYKGRRIGFFEQKLRGWKFDLNTLFKLVYSEKISGLIDSTSPLLKMLPKEFK